jgi:ABC-type dipeptide/oligopeptide/nickel transport system permease subunit
MIAGGQSRLSDVPHIVVIPSIVISLTVLSFNLLGDRRDRSARARRA